MTRLLLRCAAVLCLVALAGTAASQPFAADGGFGRPVAVAGPGIVPTFAAAEDDGVMQAVWADAGGVWVRPLFDLDATPTLLVAGRSFRSVSATTAGGDIAVAWLERDLSTGRTHHSVTWRSQTHQLFEANLEVPLIVGAAGGSPWVLAAPRSDGRANLTLYRLNTDGSLEDPLVLYSTDLGVTGMTTAGVDEAIGGPAYVAWLEGQTTTSALGADSQWSAYVMAVNDPETPLALGAADVVDQRQAVAVGHGAAGDLHALWLLEEGPLELTTVRTGDQGLEVVGRATIGETGRPVAIASGSAFWLKDAFVRRATVDASGTPHDVTSVAWSPATIDRGALVAVPEASDSATVTLAWHGRLQGGGVMAYASDDSAPFNPGLKDRIAAWMEWNPWTAWQEALGQGLTALLAGVTITLGLSPLLFLLTLLAVRLPAYSARPAIVGAVIGMLTPVIIVIVLAWRFESPELAAIVSAGNLLSGAPFILIGGLLGLLSTRTGDREPQLTAFLAACAAVFFGVSGMAFVNYHSWAAFVGLV